MQIQKISREEEVKIPKFHSHEEAQRWFFDKYGVAFCLVDKGMVGEEMCYFYYLILDWDTFKKGREEIKETGRIIGLEFLKSHQPIQIMESGSIHIVH